MGLRKYLSDYFNGRNVDLGPVNFSVNIKESSVGKPVISEEEAERELKKIGIRPYNYITLVPTFFCTSPKSTYERVFNTELGVEKIKVHGDTIRQYKKLKEPTIPSYLEEVIDKVYLNSGVIVGA